MKLEYSTNIFSCTYCTLHVVSEKEQVITHKSIKMLFIIILTLSLEVIAVVSINPRGYSFPLHPIYRASKTARTKHIVDSILSLYRGQTRLQISINCDQILRHGNKDVKIVREIFMDSY